jgi:hypothetical protein
MCLNVSNNKPDVHRQNCEGGNGSAAPSVDDKGAHRLESGIVKF